MRGGFGLLVLLLLILPGCGESEVNRGVLCQTDEECQSGRCVDGRCTQNGEDTEGDLNHADGSGDGSVDGSGDGVIDPTDQSGDQSGDLSLDGETCAEIDVNFIILKPLILMLIDQSGSMDEAFDQGMDRWEAVYDVLMGNQGVVPEFEEVVYFGLAMYSSEGGGTVGVDCPLITHVPPALNNFDDIDQVYGPARPIQDTPTAEAIDATVPLLTEAGLRAPMRLLLATDGAPDSCASPHDQTQYQASVDAVEAAFAANIKTTILSVGTDITEDHLQDLANAGVGWAPGDPDEPYFVADDTDQLAFAINEMVSNSRSCVFSISGATLAAAHAHEGTITLNGETLSHGQDWTLSEDTTKCYGEPQCVELLGEACDTILRQPEPALTGSFPCSAVQ